MSSMLTSDINESLQLTGMSNDAHVNAIMPQTQETRTSMSELSFHESLKGFPNLFFHDVVQKANTNSLKYILQDITYNQQRRLQNGAAPDLEDEKDPENIAVLLLWTLGDKRSAEERAAAAVERNPRQLLALSNVAYILWHQGNEEAATEHLKTMELLRDEESPSKYEDLDYEAQSEVVYLYIKLSNILPPFEVSQLQEKLLAKRPQDNDMKFTMAMTLTRYNHPSYSAAYPNVDFKQGVQTAASLLMEIKNDESCSNDLRGKAAAELGVLVQWNNGFVKRLGVTAKQLIHDALCLAGHNPYVLKRAAKVFRYEKDYTTSLELLERAIKIKEDPKVHHQLGLTLKQIAQQRAKIRGGSRGGRGPKQNENHGQLMPLARENAEVQQAILHFRRAVELQHEDNKPAMVDLGLILVQVGDYEEGFDQFLKIAELRPLVALHVHRVFQLAGQFVRTMSKDSADESRVIFLQEVGDFCISMSLVVLCMSLLDWNNAHSTKVNRTFWASFPSLRSVLRKDYTYLSLRSTNTIEKMLIIAVKDNRKSLPVLERLTVFLGDDENYSDGVEMEKIRRLYGRGEYSKAIVLQYLLNLMLKQADSYKRTEEEIKILLLTAKERWLKTLEEQKRQEAVTRGPAGMDIVARFSVAASHILYHQAVQLAVSMMRYSATEEAVSSASPDTEDHTPCGLSWADAVDFEESVQNGRAAADADHSYNSKTHIRFIYDPLDQTAAGYVSCMRQLLEDVCGLTISSLGDPTEGTAVTGLETNTDVGDQISTEACLGDLSGQLVVIVIRSMELSPQFASLIQTVTSSDTASVNGAASSSSSPSTSAAAATSTSSPIRVLLLDSAPLPQALRAQRFVSAWHIPPGVQPLGSRSTTSSSDVEAANSLMMSLLGA